MIYLEIFHPRWSWVSPIGIKSNQILFLTASFDPFRRNNNIVNSIWILLGIKEAGGWILLLIKSATQGSVDQPLFYKKGRIITVLLDNKCSSKFCLFYKSNGTRSRRNIKYKNCHRNFRWELLRIRSSGRGHNTKQNLQVTDWSTVSSQHKGVGYLFNGPRNDPTRGFQVNKFSTMCDPVPGRGFMQQQQNKPQPRWVPQQWEVGQRSLIGVHCEGILFWRDCDWATIEPLSTRFPTIDNKCWNGTQVPL